MIVTKPSVFIYTSEPEPGILRELCAGMEEEGVFYEITQQNGVGPDEMARRAAEDSMLGCGVALCRSRVILQIKGMKKGRCVEAYDFPTAAQSRTVGANAARIVKKQPLR